MKQKTLDVHNDLTKSKGYKLDHIQSEPGKYSVYNHKDHDLVVHHDGIGNVKKIVKETKLGKQIKERIEERLQK